MTRRRYVVYIDNGLLSAEELQDIIFHQTRYKAVSQVRKLLLKIENHSENTLIAPQELSHTVDEIIG
ncbi:MAG: hypothetical protein H0Z39_01930 [Peptococcaceae bacterium]|nr:hypothetical protein [Peptococcaceae bacterium]